MVLAFIALAIIAVLLSGIACVAAAFLVVYWRNAALGRAPRCNLFVESNTRTAMFVGRAASPANDNVTSVSFEDRALRP